jgi:glycerol-3-phosphate acyltransferase PlsY
MSAAISAPIVAFILRSGLVSMLLGFAVLVLWKHRQNIVRLKRGTEPRIGNALA